MERVRARRARLVAGFGLAAAAVVAMSTAGAMTASAADEGSIRSAGSAQAVKDSYIVVLKGDVSAQDVSITAHDLAGRYGGKVKHTYRNALRGFSVTMSERQAKRLAADPAVAYVEQDQVVRLNATQTNPPSWGLDRIDQRNLPLDNAYNYSTTASNVHAYVIDTGIRITHTDFGGRASHGYDAVDGDNVADDCNGHGTHVAGTIGGASYGVAKGVKLVAVRVLDCGGSGSYAGVIAGIDWVTANAIKPAVANMSLGGGASTAVDDAVRRSIAAGVTYALAGGNESTDACTRSPARTAEAITVGATQSNDARASYSNYGTCLDIFAPGSSITSAWHTSDTASNTISGTSMATPHVAGAAALYLADHPSATPQQVRDALVSNATPNVVSNPGSGSPNLLLYTGSEGTDPDPDPEPEPGCGTKTNGTDVAIPDGGAAVTSSINVTGCEGNAPSNLQVEVHIEHTWRGDLVIDLIAPNGTVFNLKQASLWDYSDDVHATYTVNAASSPKNGTWQLRVRDVYSGDAGYIDSWSLHL